MDPHRVCSAHHHRSSHPDSQAQQLPAGQKSQRVFHSLITRFIAVKQFWPKIPSAAAHTPLFDAQGHTLDMHGSLTPAPGGGGGGSAGLCQEIKWKFGLIHIERSSLISIQSTSCAARGDQAAVARLTADVHGQTYHRTSHVQPPHGEPPQFAQLYMLDSSQATEVRQNHPASELLRTPILDKIDRFMRQNNVLAQHYTMMRQKMIAEEQRAVTSGHEIPVVNMVLKIDRQQDQRRYNAATADEVAMIFVNEDGEPPFNRDIRIYPKNPVNSQQQFLNLSILSSNLDPMAYALLYPYGEPGWQPNWQCNAYENAQLNRIRTNVTMLQYKVAQTAIRTAEFNPVMSAGKLTQQWLVDSYLQVEANNLNYIRLNQRRLRAEQYQGLTDHVENLAADGNVAAGVPVILPSSFEGSPRNMHERCSDAMSLFAKFGAPDLFITFTANPNWAEIVDNLRPGETASDRPDLVVRVFKIKLAALMDDLWKNNKLGRSKAYVYSIEFQKRGLPHAHILITLQAEDKFTTAERIDAFVLEKLFCHLQRLELQQHFWQVVERFIVVSSFPFRFWTHPFPL
nr:uncharacterized protein LOC109424581 [Aedes albopictus]